MSTHNSTVVETTAISTETSTISTTTTTILVETTTTSSPTSTTTSIPTSTTTTSPPPDPLIPTTTSTPTSTPTLTPTLTPTTSTTPPTVIGVTKITTIGVTEITTINGTPATVIITITSTNLPTSLTPTSESSSATTSTSAVQTGGTNTSGSGLSGGALIAVAVIIPVVILAVVVVGLVLYFKRRKSIRNVPTKAPVASGIIGGSGPPPGSDRDGVYELNDTDSAGYRGWGSTVRNPKSTVSGSPGYPISSVVSDSGYSNPASVGPPGYISELYGGGVNAPASPVFPDSAGLLSADRTAPSPAFTESSTIGAMPTFDSHNGGLNRGVSNASSNYSAMTHSDQSDFDQRQSQQYYGPDAQDYDAAYFSNGPNMYYDDTSNPPPVIRDVQARRNTRIETPTSPHFPQHGSSGIAQNF